MSSEKPEQEFVRIDLTQPQKDTVKERTGKEADAIELKVTELEERIAPRQAFDLE
jgi:hypothetical protein